MDEQLCPEYYIPPTDSKKKKKKIFSKLIHHNELQFWKALAKTDIVPLVLSIRPAEHDPEYHILKTQRYPVTLGTYLEKNPDDSYYLSRLPCLIGKLHRHGILHGDLHAENVVIDPAKKTMRLIDFDGSGWISEITPQTLQKNEFRWDHAFSSVESMIDYEKNVIYYEDLPSDIQKRYPQSKKIKNRDFFPELDKNQPHKKPMASVNFFKYMDEISF
jgi:serine/threonine protein kinase